MSSSKAELLAPAGSPEALNAAIASGADAVYLGLKSFNARMRSANFAYSQFEGALRSLHRMGKKIYVTVNTVFEQREGDRVFQLLKYLSGLGPDGILVQDFGIAMMARENFPSLKLHASTQMNIASGRGVNFLSRRGFSRVVLARELSLDEVRNIRLNTNMELEVFIHGALCISVSGLCLFSSYLGGKSANRGMCTQACRRYYDASPVAAGGYYFSPADLMLIERIPHLVNAGIDSFKIEGRMKSAEYVGTVVSAYRLVLDSLGSGREEAAIGEALDILKSDFARSKTNFLIDGIRTQGSEPANWLNPQQDGGTGIFLGKLLRARGKDGSRQGLIARSVLFPETGDSIRLHRSDDSSRISHKIASVFPSEKDGLWISIPDGFDAGDSVYLIQTKALTKRYAPVIPKDLSPFRRIPGLDKAPLPHFPPGKKQRRSDEKRGDNFPEGLYVEVSRPEDQYFIQSIRPVKAILNYKRSFLSRLLGNMKQPLPFRPEEIVLFLDPFFPQSLDEELSEDVPSLLDRGYRFFVVNNPGHFSLFRNSGAALIAGFWLYAFNLWAWAFIASEGAACFISPLENNRQNLEKTISRENRSQAFITIYSRPPLFRIRSDLGDLYKFGKFTDSQGEEFRLDTAPQGSLIFPEKTFYIGDKVPFLKKAGFSRFILDFSGSPVRKQDYRDIVEAVQAAVPLKGSGRFNWKDGFFSDPSQGTKTPKNYQ